ncbi:MAG: hypothetical protein KDD37_09100 [Bdellovibrionales bacterium]|nr:hypothetical protein [Bdellovibrionales bacterium]
MSTKCPICGSAANDLIKIEAGLRLRIQEIDSESKVPPEVCVNCFRDMSSTVSQGAKLRAERNAKEHNKKVLWKNRVSLVKSARERMSVKAYAEASVLYEKYIRTLEISQDQPAGGLDLKIFTTPAFKKELMVLASVYWDLIRIYDSNPAYKQRTDITATKLLEVVPLLQNANDIIYRAERFYRNANNEDIIKNFIKEAKKKQGAKCFVATAAFGSVEAPEVLILRSFRDQVLLKSTAGKIFVRSYYFISPPIADFIRNRPKLRSMCRQALQSIASRLALKFNLNNKT